MDAIGQKTLVQGLRSPVEIIIDRWGVPHIYADNAQDLFFAQGYQSARDRLWQMDIWRRRGLGQLAEVFGAPYIDQDATARLLLYRGETDTEWAHYGADARDRITAFVRGINAHVVEVRAGTVTLPPEFVPFDYLPSLWEPEDILRIRAGGRHDNAREEVMRSVTIAAYGLEAERLRKPLSNGHVLTVPEGLDLDDIDAQLLAGFEQFMGFLSAGDKRLVDGSNNWVLSGSRTQTGRPILANDPHREMTLPGLRYICHLNAPGINVIGATEPYRPGISSGHNESVAFGFTIFPCDQEDLYVYELDDAGRYLYAGEWLAFETIEETFAVRGAAAEVRTLRFSRHGPVIAERPDRKRAFGLRAAWLSPGAVPYLKANLRLIDCTTADAVREVIGEWASPGLNFVFADIEGNIGIQSGGLVPARPNWDGLMPVPGDGRYEWNGFVPVSELLGQTNPEAGWVGSANQYNVPAPIAARYPISLEVEPIHRYLRLAEILDLAEGHGVADSLWLQFDVVSRPAQTLVGLLADTAFANPALESARRLLLDWDCTLGADSRAAALFEVWWRQHLLPRTMERHLAASGLADAKAAVAHILAHTDSSKTPQSWLDLVAQQFAEGGAAVLAETLEAALASLPDRQIPTWGDLHKSDMRHPLQAVLAGAGLLAADDLVAGPPSAIPGDGDTLNNTGFGAGWTQRIGASVRFVHDVGAWDNSLAMNTPGQSGVPGSAHFNDLYQDWLGERAFPLVFGREAVSAAAEQRMLLEPGEAAR